MPAYVEWRSCRGNAGDAGVFPPGTCAGFGSAFLKSRSSASFPAEVKDFVAPQPVNISNCGRIIIRKVTSPSPDPTDTTFAYTTTGGLNPATFGLKDGQSRDYGATVQQGSYSVTETDPGPNFAPTNIDCSASSTAGGSSATPTLGTGTVAIVLKPNDTIDCTYTNVLQSRPEPTELSASLICSSGRTPSWKRKHRQATPSTTPPLTTSLSTPQPPAAVVTRRRSGLR
jgi:hypothetical protein